MTRSYLNYAPTLRQAPDRSVKKTAEAKPEPKRPKTAEELAAERLAARREQAARALRRAACTAQRRHALETLARLG